MANRCEVLTTHAPPLVSAPAFFVIKLLGITNLIYFTLHNGFNCWMLGHLSYDSSITTTNNKNLKMTIMASTRN